MGEIRKIKRYSNRKLYDMNESRYVTLDEVAAFVQAGDEVQILDNRTKEDITSVTLAQIVYEQEKKRKNFLPLHTLKGIIRSSGKLLQEKIATPVASFVDETERTVNSLRADAERRVATMREEAERALHFVMDRGDARPLVRELADSTTRAYEDFARGLDDGLKQVLRGLRAEAHSPAWRQALESRLEALEARLERLERRDG
ncbi:MAG: transcriptional regulator [Deltaproteobacteria bacterium]|nr:transcriptional regulator [Deltaproteobacteria bacterium]